MKNLILFTLVLIGTNHFLFSTPKNSISKIKVNTQLLLQSGKLIAAGYIETEHGMDLAVQCYDLNGQLDHNFAQAGTFVLSIPQSNEQVLKLYELEDGGIQLAGQSSNFPKADLLLARLNSKGELDKSFSAHGYSISEIGDGMAIPQQITAFGSGYLVGGIAKKDGHLQQFIRAYQSNGQAFREFGQNGQLFIGNNAQMKDLKVLYNHHILLLGEKLIQISPKGQILEQHYPHFQASCLAISKKEFYLGGSSKGAFLLQKFDAKLQPKQTPQKYYLPYQNAAQLEDIKVQNDGCILLAGQVDPSTLEHDSDWILMQLDAEMKINPKFAQAGIFQVDCSQEDDVVEQIAIHQDKIMLLGFANSFEDQQAHAISCPQ